MAYSPPATIPTASHNAAAHHRRTHRRALNVATARPTQVVSSTSPHQQPEPSSQNTTAPRNVYPQLGLQLSQWVEEQMEGKPAPWMEPWYTLLDAPILMPESDRDNDDGPQSPNEDVSDVQESALSSRMGSNSRSTGLRVPRIGRRRGLLEAQIGAAPPQSDLSLQQFQYRQPSISQPSASQEASISQPDVSQHSMSQHSMPQHSISQPSMSQEEIREVLLLHQCPAPKRLLQGIQYMVEQQCFPCGRGPLSSWLHQLASFEDRTTLNLRVLLPGCYHIMMRSVKEISDSWAALESLLSFSPHQVNQYVSQNPHLLYKTTPHLLADFDALLRLTRFPRQKLLAMVASHPGLLGHTHDGLRLKWQRLQIAASTSARWQAEISGDDVDLRLLASTVCAPHADLDRLTFLCAQAEQDTHSLVQAVTCTDTAFRQAHPGYKEFQLQHALLGVHYAACTHPTQRLLLEGGASLPRGSAGKWVNLFLQQRGQREATEELEMQHRMYLEWQHALALQLVQQDEWDRALGL